MPIVHTDKIESLSAEEDRGVIRTLSRKVRVQFTAAEIANARNQDVLSLALAALDDNGMKAMHNIAGTVITSAASRFGPLVCTKRSPAVIENDPQWVDVILKYDHILDGHNQLCVGPASGLLFAKGKASIVDKTTNFFYPEGIRDESKKTQIQVWHTFPKTQVGIAGIPVNPLYPRTVESSGEISIPFPQGNIHLQGLIATTRPQTLARSIIACINSVTWMGEDPLTWVCSEAAWEVNDPSTHLPTGALPIAGPNYKFSFEFQYNVDTWDPAVVFNDQRTGRPPANVEEATDVDDNGVKRLRIFINDLGDTSDLIPAGLWKVPALRRLDFNEFFKAVFEAAAPVVV